MKHKEPEEGAGKERGFAIGDMVRFKTDPAEKVGIVTGCIFRPCGLALLVSVAGEEHTVYDFEIMHFDEYGFGSIGGEN